MEKDEMRRRLLGVTAMAARYCAVVERSADFEPREFAAEMLQLLPRLYIEFNDIVPAGKKKSLGRDFSDDHDHECCCGHDHDHDCCCGHDHDHDCGSGDDCDCDCDHHHGHDCGCGHHHSEEELDPYGTVSLDDSDGFGDDDDENPYYGNYLDEDYYESVRRHIEQLLGPADVFLETFEEDMKYSDTPIAASIAECLADIFLPLYNFISIVKDTEGDELEGAYRECHNNFTAYWSQTLCNVLRALNHYFYSPD
ncbi:MAG: DUF5063 domain-containing protein [Muribaculaceae bacterium]|nr:DUF5063 domain-containing protein [Muribaculaceae bacterium]